MASRVRVTFSLPSLAKTVKAAFSIRCNIKFLSWPVSSRYLYDRRACQLVYTYSPIEGNSWGDEINRRGGKIYRLLQDRRRLYNSKRRPHLLLLLLSVCLFVCCCRLFVVVFRFAVVVVFCYMRGCHISYLFLAFFLAICILILSLHTNG